MSVLQSAVEEVKLCVDLTIVLTTRTEIVKKVDHVQDVKLFASVSFR